MLPSAPLDVTDDGGGSDGGPSLPSVSFPTPPDLSLPGQITPDGSSDDSSSNADEIDTSNQTLGTTGLGGASDLDDSDPVEVNDTSTNPSDSSPAGGAGAEEATERFSGVEDEALDDESSSTIIDVAQQTSDTLREIGRSTDLDPTETSSVPAVAEAVANDQPNASGPAEDESSTMPSMPSLPDAGVLSSPLVLLGGAVLAAVAFLGGEN